MGAKKAYIINKLNKSTIPHSILTAVLIIFAQKAQCIEIVGQNKELKQSANKARVTHMRVIE